MQLTADHKMFTIHERRLIKKRLDACLADGDLLCLVDRIPAWRDDPVQPDVDPYLVGAILTDGCIRLWDRKGSVTFTQKPEPAKVAFTAVVQENFLQV